MKSYYVYIFWGIVSSCSEIQSQRVPIIEPTKILSSIANWSIYQWNYLRLSENFIALDFDGNVITKEIFLNHLTSGNYLPLKLKSKDSLTCYKLYELDTSVDKDIRSVIKEFGKLEYEHYKMEGKELPNFDLIDLKGNIYNKETTKGNILVLKCWFIHCLACNKETPYLNELVVHYKNRKDILFVSLATDKSEDLKAFLAKTSSNYEVVPDQENYIINYLKITQFPTHIVINKEGKIAKVVNTYDELSTELKSADLK
jgi:peroxiredoxin